MALNLNVNAAALALNRNLVVDLSPEPAKAKVVREGYQVPVVALNPQQSSFFLDNLQQIPLRQEPRVVSQTIPAGTKVLPGTAVDLVMAPTASIPFKIFDKVHAGLADKTLTVLDPLLDNPSVRQTLLKYGSAADVTVEDKTALISAFNQTEVLSVNEASSTTNFQAAFESARNALAFR